jgi:hypothetical protein
MKALTMKALTMGIEMRPIGVGTSDFQKIIMNNYFYVDKSLVIKEIMDKGDEVFLFLRPRRFGKTTTLSMLEHFFEIKENNNSTSLFTRLKIWQDETYRQMQGKYPVISLTFKNMEAENWEEAARWLTTLLRDLYLKHKYILTAKVLE